MSRLSRLLIQMGFTTTFNNARVNSFSRRKHKRYKNVVITKHFTDILFYSIEKGEEQTDKQKYACNYKYH